MDAVAYIRVSTARQGRSGLGLEAQARAIDDYVKANGCNLLATYREVESGRHDDRPELHKALELCRLTGARLVIAKLDRLGRNAEFLFHIRQDHLHPDPQCGRVPLHRWDYVLPGRRGVQIDFRPDEGRFTGGKGKRREARQSERCSGYR